MKPLQVYMDEADLARLDAWSRRRGMSKSQAVRAALRAAMRAEDSDPVLGLSGSVQGLAADASADFDRYLEETFVAQPPQSGRLPKARIRR
jgi:hypothetical protein